MVGKEAGIWKVGTYPCEGLVSRQLARRIVKDKSEVLISNLGVLESFLPNPRPDTGVGNEKLVGRQLPKCMPPRLQSDGIAAAHQNLT